MIDGVETARGARSRTGDHRTDRADLDPAFAAPMVAPAGSRDTGIETPMTWRVTALLFLFGTALAGLAAARRVGPRSAAALVAIGAPAIFLPIAAGNRRRQPVGGGRTSRALTAPILPIRSSSKPSLGSECFNPAVTVIVAARDERESLPSLLADLGHQDLVWPAGGPAFEVIVIDDRSRDGTGSLARAAADAAGIGDITTVVRRDGERLADGKGAALAAWPVEACRGDVIVVLDADARIGPGYLRTLARAVAMGHRATAGRIRIRRAGGGILSHLQDDEQALDAEIQRGRWMLGGCPELRGNGIVVSRLALVAAGGWRPSLTEDLDLSARLAIRGLRVAWLDDCHVTAEAVVAGRDLFRQRVRWAEGSCRRFLEHGPRLLARGRLPLRARLDFGAYSMQLAVPGLLVGAVIGAVRTHRPWAAAGMAATYAAGLGVLSVDALRAGPNAPRARPWLDRVGGGAGVVVLSTIWIVAVPVALLRLAFRRGPVTYAKMAHTGDAAGGSQQ